MVAEKMRVSISSNISPEPASSSTAASSIAEARACGGAATVGGEPATATRPSVLASNEVGMDDPNGSRRS
ncbi:MAG: hypothetical protein AMXMBFR83_18400 [Phycisphaerae bacterium]